MNVSDAYSVPRSITTSSTSADGTRVNWGPLLQLQQSVPNNNNDIMRRAILRRGAAAMVIATITAINPQNAVASTSQIPSLNSPAPDFSLINTRGQTVTLDTLTADNKWTILYFYPGAFTSGCTIEARKFQEDLPLYQELNAQVVGVSVDSVTKNSEFCTSEGLDFFMLADDVRVQILNGLLNRCQDNSNFHFAFVSFYRVATCPRPTELPCRYPALAHFPIDKHT